MKTILLILFFLFSGNGFAQDLDFRSMDNSKGTSMKPILAASLPLIQIAEEGDAEIVRMEFDIISDEKFTYRELHEGVNYGILAFGDYRIRDIDLVLYKYINNQWVEIKRDTDASSSALVKIEPSFTGTYAIKVIAHRYYEGYSKGHYGLLIIR
ncbi:MAG: hypothetical protein N2450_08210 [bacterium]|nr:hypothetical protein [bacterium]